MALNLASLLQSVGIAPGLEEDVTTVIGDPIQKKRAKSSPIDFPDAPGRPPLSNGPDAPDLGNRSYVEAARAALANNPERKGVFGSKGTLRDILGTVGDAFLIQSGNKPIYAPKREQERMSDALAGFTENPLAAIERLAQVDGAAAADLLNQVKSSQIKQSELANQSAILQNKVENEGDDRYQQYSKFFSQYAGASTPETYKRVAPILKTFKERGKLGDEYIIPDEYDGPLLKSYQFGGMPATQQLQTNIRQETLEQRERLENLKEEGRNRRYTPPQPRQAPQPTAASLAAPLIEKVKRGEPLTKGQQETLNRLGFSADRGKGRTRAVPPLPPGFKPK